MCEMWGHSRGFSVDWPRLKNKSKYYKKGWLGAYSQSNLIFFNLQLVTEEASSRTGTRPGASNQQGSVQLAAWMRGKTERGDRGDRRDVLTNGGDRRRWTDFGEERRPAVICLHAVAVLQWPARD
jgi:hypothetical protein